jgi:hypothetical protein
MANIFEPFLFYYFFTFSFVNNMSDLKDGAFGTDCFSKFTENIIKHMTKSLFPAFVLLVSEALWRYGCPQIKPLQFSSKSSFFLELPL